MKKDHTNTALSGKNRGFSLIEVMIAMAIFAIGILAVGSVDPERYHTDMGTVLVNHLGAIINKIFLAHLNR